ncbi:hypothetical protein [Cohnella luojiensis]|uniref:hypothetical protein n=1 Tax=Cohnella luojiensis TaxID=652876 RepID=UPI001430595B|nr:hypothetical protein [Cohnella luojiensis]
MDQTETNEELRDLRTHMAGATDLHETREHEPENIDPPVAPTTGAFDERPPSEKHGN